MTRKDLDLMVAKLLQHQCTWDGRNWESIDSDDRARYTRSAEEITSTLDYLGLLVGQVSRQNAQAWRNAVKALAGPPSADSSEKKPSAPETPALKYS